MGTLMEQLEEGGTQRVSSLENPEMATAIAQQVLAEANDNETEQEPPLFIEGPPDTTVTLPGGLLDADGTLHTDAEVRELTGVDEELLSKADATKNASRYVKTLLRCGVIRIGTYEKITDDLLDALLLGDRDALILGIRKATYGHEFSMRIACPFCSAQMDATYDLNTDVPVKTMDAPEQRIYEVELRNDRKASVMLPCAGDADAVLNVIGKTVAEQNTMMLARCVQRIDGRPVVGANDVRALGLQDRRTILDFLADKQPGPKYEEVKQTCLSCDEEIPLRLTLMDLFRG